MIGKVAIKTELRLCLGLVRLTVENEWRLITWLVQYAIITVQNTAMAVKNPPKAINTEYLAFEQRERTERGISCFLQP
jgi:hypothetical protein